MANIKNWSEFLKDVPTDALVSEIESRKSQKSGSVSKTAADIMKKIDEAIKMFGSYSFDDKGPDEVMDIDSITAKLKGKPVKEIGTILSVDVLEYSGYTGDYYIYIDKEGVFARDQADQTADLIKWVLDNQETVLKLKNQ
jgi:hypothetical protein